jgi:hypothetical protein
LLSRTVAEQFAEMMRSEVGRNLISTINAFCVRSTDVRRSYTESKLRIQARTKEVREEEKKLPTKEEMQEVFERLTGEFMRRARERETDRRVHEEIRDTPSGGRGDPGTTMVRRRRRVRFLS